MMTLGVSLSLVGGGCGSDDGLTTDIEGTVQGSSLGASAPSLAVYRLADTPLSPSIETLDFYFGEGFVSFCPDIGEPTSNETTLIFGLRGKIGVGDYSLCDSGCSGDYLDIGFDGWRLPSGETIRPTAGTVKLTAFDDEHVAGSLSLDFDGEQVSGEFTIAIACVDSRPRA